MKWGSKIRTALLGNMHVAVKTYLGLFNRIYKREVMALLCRVADFRYKDVVCVNDGTRLGCVCDVEIDTGTASLVSIVIYGKYRLFGLLGREDDIVIGWNDIQLIGEDTILVNYCCPVKRPRGLGGLGGLFHA